MSRFSRLAVLLPAAALLVAIVPSSAPAGDEPTATAAKRCSAGGAQSYDTTYVYSPIRARNIGCTKARRLVRRFHECRPNPGGRCPSPGTWTCRENRFNVLSYQYDSRVRCTKGGKVVRHRYQQNR